VSWCECTDTGITMGGQHKRDKSNGRHRAHGKAKKGMKGEASQYMSRTVAVRVRPPHHNTYRSHSFAFTTTAHSYASLPCSSALFTSSFCHKLYWMPRCPCAVLIAQHTCVFCCYGLVAAASAIAARVYCCGCVCHCCCIYRCDATENPLVRAVCACVVGKSHWHMQLRTHLSVLCARAS
jgi:hypothetical protein